MTERDDTEARIRELLGTATPPEDHAAEPWLEGYGVTSPDVTRYAEVLREVPDAVVLAMLNVADADESRPTVDPDTAGLIQHWVYARQPKRVLELGTGVGYLTTMVARAVPADCIISTIEVDPERAAAAHAFFEHEPAHCTVELRLGDPLAMLVDQLVDAWDLVLLSDPSPSRIDALDLIVPRMTPGALLVVPFALLGGRVADNVTDWGADSVVELQRRMNRQVASDPRLCDPLLLPVGDGLLLARRR